ncbi:MAG: hypothetical protein GX931_01200 [Acholeplasmataceae bacterium]|nr:hypothetical protein [Acholeplasmataceae bacterium]
MLYDYTELINKYKNDYQIKKALKEKRIYKLKPGLYSDKPKVDTLKILMHERKDAILTLQSAFYYYGLTDYIPKYIYVATPQNAYPINNSKIKQIFLKNHKLGKIKIKQNDYYICIYDLERTLIELIRYETKMPYEEYYHVLRNFRKVKNKLDFNKLNNYAKQFRSYEKIIKTIEMAII